MPNIDKEKFADIYDQCAPTAYGLACRMLGNRTEAEDVVQHAFVSLWNHAEEFDASIGRISTWLYVFVRNRCIDVLRRRKNHVPVTLTGSDDDAGHDVGDGLLAIDAQVDAKLSSQRVREALARLPEAQRKVIDAAYFAGLTQQEIADQFNEPLGTVKTRMRLGMLKLAELLKKEVEVA